MPNARDRSLTALKNSLGSIVFVVVIRSNNRDQSRTIEEWLVRIM
jgi:hypothetical protein